MITISILINGQPLYTRSAFRLEGKQGEVCKYKCDDGSIITHNYDDGAVELGHKLLNTIKELKRQKIKAQIEILKEVLENDNKL